MSSKSAFITIVGRPNVGKSTLLNALVGEKVAIVSPRPQTTRNRITGILTQGEVQFVFIDTPGIHKPKTRLGEYMAREIRESVADVDAAVLVTEPEEEIRTAERELLESFRQRKLPVVLAVNKIDSLPRKELMLKKIQQFSELFEFDRIIPISALRRDGIDLLLESLQQYAVDGPHYFDDDDYTDQPERVIVAEIIREKILCYMREEIPHGTAVTIEEMKERDQGGLLDIRALIVCEKDSHKGMLIGKRGEMLKRIATSARLDIQAFLDTKIHLECWVKVKDDWRNRDNYLREFGFRH